MKRERSSRSRNSKRQSDGRPKQRTDAAAWGGGRGFWALIISITAQNRRVHQSLPARVARQVAGTRRTTNPSLSPQLRDLSILAHIPAAIRSSISFLICFLSPLAFSAPSCDCSSSGSNGDDEI
jgi:hypothetical protein